MVEVATLSSCMVWRNEVVDVMLSNWFLTFKGFTWQWRLESVRLCPSKVPPVFSTIQTFNSVLVNLLVASF